MQNVNRRLIARVGGVVVVCLLVATFGALLLYQASLRGQGKGVAPLAAADTPTPPPIDTPAPITTPVPTGTPLPTQTSPAPTTTPSPLPVVLVLDSASGGSTANQPGYFHYTASISTSPLRPNVVANFTVSYCGQVRYTAASYLDPTGHATFHDNLLVQCSLPFTITLTGLSLTQGPAGDEPLHGSVSFTISS
jgi:hypothetical protein